MQDILSVGEMRMSDAAAISTFVPGMELMRRAGEGIFRAAQWKPPVAVVCGTGNNAGDGYVTAMMLQEAGRQKRESPNIHILYALAIIPFFDVVIVSSTGK